MALELERVKEKFYAYSGEDPLDTGARGALCARLCEECAAETEALLASRRAVLEEGDAGRLESWTAAQAFYQLALADEAVSPGKVSADGVSVEPGERSGRARALAHEKRRGLGRLLGEEAFCFGRI